MPRGVKRTAGTARGPTGPVVDPSTDELLDLKDSSVFSQEYGPEAYIRLYRLDDLDKVRVFHGRFSPDEFDEELVSQLFGGGTYEATLHERDSTGKVRIKQAKRMKIPGKYRPPSKLPGVDGQVGYASAEKKGVAEQVTAAAAASPGGSGFAGTGTASPNELLNMAMVHTVLDLFKSTREAMSGSSPIIAMMQENMKQQAEVFKAVLGSVGHRGEPDQMKDFQQMFDLVKGLVPGAGTPPASPSQTAIKDIVDAIRTLRGAAEDVSPNRGDDPALDNMGRLLGVLEAGIRSGKTPQAPDPVRALPPGEPPAVKPDPFPPGTPEYQKVLLANKKQLLGAIQMGLSADTVAEVALKRLPPRLVPAITEFFTAPDVVAKAVAVIPELAQYPQWTEEFIDAALDLLGVPVEEEESAPTEGADAPGGPDDSGA